MGNPPPTITGRRQTRDRDSSGSNGFYMSLTDGKVCILRNPGRENTTAVFNKGFYRIAARRALVRRCPAMRNEGGIKFSATTAWHAGLPRQSRATAGARLAGKSAAWGHSAECPQCVNLRNRLPSLKHLRRVGNNLPLGGHLAGHDGILAAGDPMLNGVKVSSRLTVLLVVV